MGVEPGPETLRRRELAARVVDAVAARTPVVAVLLIGSAARGDADAQSDVDIALWCDALTDGDPVGEALDALGAGRRAGDRARVLDGVRVDAGLQTAARVEQAVERVLTAADPGEPLTKVVIGLRTAVPLRGAALVEPVRARTDDYPDALAHGLITANLNVYPIWREHRHIAARDARLFEAQMLVDGAFAVLAMLSGLNRVYFTRFQLTRMRHHIATLHRAPPRLAERLESLLVLDVAAASDELARLLRETVALIERDEPDVDVSRPRADLGEGSL